MKKNTTFLAAFLMSMTAFGQVGINTANPHPSASLELASTNRALYLNRVANTAAINNPQSGMVIYDLTDKCVKAYQGNPAGWSGCLVGNNGLVGSVTSLNCAGAYFTPSFATVGQAYTGTLTVPYTGGNGGIYPSQTTTVNGLTFNLPLGVFANGDGNVVYNVTGTPTTAGTTSVNVTVGGQSCSGANALSLTVNPATGNPVGVLPGTVTLAKDSRYWVASVYDNDYMPYTKPTAPASTAVINADGTPDTLVDVQGSITTTGITVYIPATVTGSGGTVAAWSSTTTIPANLTQNGVATQVTLSWATQTLTASNSSLVATIKAVGNDLLAKKLDINAGIGNDYLGLLLGTFQYPYNAAGNLTNYELRDIPGIPDRMFGQIDNASKYEHNFLYLPIQAEDGKIWLNNNLGANYANVDHPSFNLAQQAQSYMLPYTNTDPTLKQLDFSYDKDAMGSLFQWGRRADGHELTIRETKIKYQAYPQYQNASYKYGLTIFDNDPYSNSAYTSTTWTPTTPQRLELRNLTYWIVGITAADANKWSTSSSNNPCPQGFKVPTQNEWKAVVAASPSKLLIGASHLLRLTRAGGTNGSSSNGIGMDTDYAVSDGFIVQGSYNTGAVPFFDGKSTIYPTNYAGASVGEVKSVRCIKE